MVFVDGLDSFVLKMVGLHLIFLVEYHQKWMHKQSEDQLPIFQFVDNAIVRIASDTIWFGSLEESSVSNFVLSLQKENVDG